MSHLITRLWSSFRVALTLLRASIAPLATLDRKERRALHRWLVSLEVYGRRVVLLEALRLGRLEAASPASHARPKTRGPRTPRLRLWPRATRPRARIRLLGPPTSLREIWREQHRATLIARLRAARAYSRARHLILADRIDALESIITAPTRAARRLARKLVRLPSLALKLVMARLTFVRGVAPALYDELQDALFPPALALNSS